MNRTYKNINSDSFNNGIYSLVPIRDEDKYDIMNWRNNQLDILRQETVLLIEQQEIYFKTVVDKLFDVEKPKQLLFSFLENNKLIGYGGLVHIDWETKTAEVSFLTETSRNKNADMFISDWVNYLAILKKIATDYLNFTCIYTYAYDLRQNLYIALQAAGFAEINRRKNHININDKNVDVVIHSLDLNPISMRVATSSDVDLYYAWVNDESVRHYSFQQDEIQYENHVNWFNSRIENPNFLFLVFFNQDKSAIGQVRINKNDEEVIIGISVDKNYRGFGYSFKMLRLACQHYFKNYSDNEIFAYIKLENKASIATFKKAGFLQVQFVLVNNIESVKLKITK
jgi:RimJ/RimL family protein N-acetyltransferase